jgi:hypothetical protein
LGFPKAAPLSAKCRLPFFTPTPGVDPASTAIIAEFFSFHQHHEIIVPTGPLGSASAAIFSPLTNVDFFIFPPTGSFLIARLVKKAE